MLAKVCGKDVTLPNMDDEQQVFDYVVNHLLTQKKKSFLLTLHPSCAYRGQDNTCCAAGCLIPDDRYHTHFETHGAHTLFIFSKLKSSVMSLVSELQRIHDIRGVAEWPGEFQRLAKECDLRTNF